LIPIFKAEVKDGLEQKITSNASIAYCSAVEVDIDKSQFLKSSLPALAAKDDPDLYHTLSILVTTSWNKNDDVFSKDEVWVSRNSPEDKQTNIEHNDNKIVGHIVGNWPVDEQNKLISGDTPIDDLPDIFHILTASVIYRQRSNPETKQEVDELIASIESGKRFVSMECMFKGFDYAIRSPDGKNHILARSSETAFLTKHLRAYGGSGEYDGHRIGRLLRNITFSGKGFVNKPANPSSIIFDSGNLIHFNHASKWTSFSKNDEFTFSRLSEESCMSDKILEDQIAELKASVKELTTQNEDLKINLAKADVTKFESTIETQKSEIEGLKSDLTKAGTNSEALENKVKDLEKNLSEATEAKDKLTKDFETIKAESLQNSRIAVLVGAGLDKDLAKAKVELFANLNDEQFDALSKDLIKAFSTKKEDKEDSSNDDKVLDTAKVDDQVSLTASDDDTSKDELETVRAGFAQWADNVFQLSGEES
jgi:hypothetical protein